MAQKVFNKELVPSLTSYDAQRISPKDLRPDPVLNGRVSLPDIAKFKRDFLDPNVGQVQPITIAKLDGLPVIVDGVTRWRAALEITKEGIGPHENGAFMLKCQYSAAKTPLERYTLTVKANIRNEPTPEDEAHSIAIFLHTFGLPEEDIAARIYGRFTLDGKPDIKWLRERNAMNDLTADAMIALKGGKMDSKAAIALAKLTPEKQREKLTLLDSGQKLTVAAIKRSTSTNGSGTAASAAALNKNGSDPLTVAEFRNSGTAERKIRTVSDFRSLVQEYIDMDIPERIKGFTCENAVRKILSDLLDDLK